MPSQLLIGCSYVAMIVVFHAHGLMVFCAISKILILGPLGPIGDKIFFFNNQSSKQSIDASKGLPYIRIYFGHQNVTRFFFFFLIWISNGCGPPIL